MSPSVAHMEEPRGNVLINAHTGQAIPLAMQRLELAGRVTPAGAMLRVTHRFKCEGTNPMEALYTFMLPRNGTLRRFVVKGEDFEVESKLEPRKEARKQYEEGMQAGHLSVLAEANSDGLISLSVGQVKPDEPIMVILDIVSGVDLKDKTYRFRFPFTLAPNYHANAKATSTSGGGKLELPSDVFGDIILPEWKADATGLHQVAFRMHVEASGKLDSVSSPSHRILVRPNGDGSAEIELSGTSDVPNRDLVLDVNAKEAAPALFADAQLVSKKTETDDPKIPKGAPRWTAVIPSSLVPKAADAPRKVCFVMDNSGSMSGIPIERAKVALNACLSALQPTDTFGMLWFNSTTGKFHDKMVEATDANRKRAFKWLANITANGGTELMPALGDAVDILDGPGGDIFLLTDGEVFDTGEIIEQNAVDDTRIHVLGIGSASQDRFLANLARRSGGVERMVGHNEDVAAAAMELFNAVRQPVQTKVKAFATVGKKASQEQEIGTIWEGYAILVTDNGTTGDSLPSTVTLSWGTGPKDKVKVALDFTQETPNGLNALLWAGRRVEDLDSALDTAKKGGAAHKTTEKELKEVSETYGLATRVMSLVAVVHRAGDQAGVQADQKVVAVGIPEGMDGAGVFGGARGLNLGTPISAGGSQLYGATVNFVSSAQTYGFSGGGTKGLVGSVLRSAAVGSSVRSRSLYLDSSQTNDSYSPDSDDILDSNEINCAMEAPVASAMSDDEDYEPATKSSGSVRFRAKEKMGIGAVNTSGMVRLTADLLGFLINLQADGGMPGKNDRERLLRTMLLALAAYMEDKNAPAPKYAMHLTRMVGFLKTQVANFPGDNTLARLIPILESKQKRVEGDWELAVNQVISNPNADHSAQWTKMNQAISAA